MLPGITLVLILSYTNSLHALPISVSRNCLTIYWFEHLGISCSTTGHRFVLAKSLANLTNYILGSFHA